MTKPNGIHHLAVSTGNMKAQIEFFTDVLGMELVALYWMHGVEDAWHGFLKLNDDCSLAFVYVPGNENIPSEIGVSHSGSGAGPSAPGTTQHIAFNVSTMEELLNMRDRVRSRGINITGPIRHGLCQSIYFFGLEDLTLEIATNDTAEHPLDSNHTWIEGGAVPQPPYDENMPHPKGDAIPLEMYKMGLLAPDEAIAEAMNETTPPNL